MRAKNMDFDLILTQKWVILAAILDFMGQIIKMTPEMDFLTPKTYLSMGHTWLSLLASYFVSF